jgi:two-component system, OmpR family, phosphate regulon sensor histidine kinase PhoR
MSNQTPRSVAINGALVISGAVSLIQVFIFWIVGTSLWWIIPVVFLVIFPISYFVILTRINKHISHKLRLLYKTIQSLKGSPEKGNINLEEAEEEIAQWAENRVLELRKVKATDTYRKEFIGNLAHELKTPIFSIQGYVETLLDGEVNDPSLVRNFLQKASNNVDRLSSLVKDLDLITRIESDQLPLSIKKFDVVQLVRTVMELLEEKASQRNIQLLLGKNTPEVVYVEADFLKIEQVLVNLITNAIHYGRENGKVTADFFDIDDDVLIEITDDGLGIGQEHLPRIFERFYRVDKSRSRHEGGSGLGLAICKHIIESHGQTISVRSKIGVGSTFHFTLKKSTKDS